MEPETRSMVGLLYVLKDEVCAYCAGKGELRFVNPKNDEAVEVLCQMCDGKGVRTFKVELSQALRQIKGA